MGEGLAKSVGELFNIMTSGIGSFGKGLGTGLAETAKYSFFEVSEAGLGAYGGVVAFGLAVSLAMSACYMVFNIL